MKENPESAAGLDRLVHEPARLVILTALSELESADFLFLLRLAGLTKGNLSSHLDKLEGAGLVEVEKRFVGKKTNTRVRITEGGRAAVGEHWRRLDDLRHRSLRSGPPS